MKLYTDKPDYVRLDDDVSFQILRTNPKLTTNTKLMYDGENLYMDSYSVNPLLSTMKYKHHRVWKTGFFNRDIRNFLLGTDMAAYEVGKISDDTVILNNFDNQFENTYWCGVESIKSSIYPQEMGCIAPLYLRKKLPNYFVIFKIDNPANINLSAGYNDPDFSFKEDIQKKVKIIKAFSLKEGTPIGDYIRRYVEQKNFKYDQSIYVNFSANEIYYYGIDKSNGVLTQKVENFEEALLKNDNPIINDDNWITSGFERNNLIFPYILNIEFLFDDKDIQEYKFARYFGMYCNDIDLYDVEVENCINTDEDGNKLTLLRVPYNDENYIDFTDNNNGDGFYYIKDKDNYLHSINSTISPGYYRMPGKIDIEKFKGYEKTTVSTYCERLPGTGRAFMILEIINNLIDGETLTAYDEIANETVGTFIATRQLGSGEFYNNRFSCKGTIYDMASALAGCIRECESDNFRWITAFSSGNKVIIRSLYPGENMNNLFNFTGSVLTASPKKIKKITPHFAGGTYINGCMFKIYTSDIDVFVDSSNTKRDGDVRYIKSGIGKDNAKILSVLPYINDDKKIDDTYSLLITDENGPYVNISKTEQIEILDKFYPHVGILSFFPVKDFDFDTISSQYSNYTMFQNEINAFIEKHKNSQETNDVINEQWVTEEEITITNPALKDSIPYKRFYENNKDVGTEYDYYCENILPELTVVNKTVPYIAKWGYMDLAKDSCENPYRLNMSKIFDTSNLSSNTFMQNGDVNEYTHSMPYYVITARNKNMNDTNNINEYHYILMPNQSDAQWGNRYEDLLEYFSKPTADGGDPFDEMFGDTSESGFNSKRFNKKYSRFLFGNDAIKSSTLFRGVKFEVTELVDGKEVKTGKYNDYRFSFIYVPYCDKNENDSKVEKVHFIKNDNYKFIVGIVMFNVQYSNIDVFNKAFVYAGSMGFLKKN